MVTKRVRLVIDVTNHKGGGRFYQWELRNVERWEVLDILETLVNDLKSGKGIIVRSMPEPSRTE